MRITPLNIKKQDFKKSFRGFNTEEVDLFLEKIANEFEKILTENDSIKKQLEDANLQLSEFKRIEKNLQDTLIRGKKTPLKHLNQPKGKLT